MNESIQPVTAALSGTAFAPVITAVKTHGEALRAIPGVFGVRPGLRMVEGQLTQEPALIIVTYPNEPVGELPVEVDGLPVQARSADVREMVEGLEPLSLWEGALPGAAPAIRYTPPDPAEASLVEQRVRNITCAVGPDSGWSTLKPFLEGVQTSLTVAMYEFDADHIIDTLTRIGAQGNARLRMILQVSSNDQGIEAQLRAAWGERLEFARALVSGPQRIFNSAYHTKVAVRDSKAMWLSSGNWTHSSQPEIAAGEDPFLYRQGNREWHAVIEDQPLAQIYENFIRYDMRQASGGVPVALPVRPDLLVPLAGLEREAAVGQDHPFQARTYARSGQRVRVVPLLSPDNYAREILKLIQGASRSLYLQFSYIRQPSSGVFDEIIDCIREKMHQNLDVRVLVSRNQVSEHTDMLMGMHGWKPEMVRRQMSRMHNKGIIVDSKVAVVGSHNWSSDGTQFNRDASLIIYSPAIARYFREVFLFDWNHLSAPAGSQPQLQPVLAPERARALGESVSAAGLEADQGLVRIPWHEWFGD